MKKEMLRLLAEIDRHEKGSRQCRIEIGQLLLENGGPQLEGSQFKKFGIDARLAELCMNMAAAESGSKKTVAVHSLGLEVYLP